MQSRTILICLDWHFSSRHNKHVQTDALDTFILLLFAHGLSVYLNILGKLESWYKEYLSVSSCIVLLLISITFLTASLVLINFFKSIKYQLRLNLQISKFNLNFVNFKPTLKLQRILTIYSFPFPMSSGCCRIDLNLIISVNGQHVSIYVFLSANFPGW